LVSDGQKLLEYTLEKVDEVLMGMLLAKGADPHVSKVEGPSSQSLFDWAVEENKPNLVKQLIHTGKVKPSTEAVYKAAQKGHKKMLEHFKKHGFIDVTDENQNSALARAVNQREKQTFEVLLQQGADPTIEDQEGKRVLTKAIDYKKLEFLAGILDRQALVAIFLENGADSLVSDGQKLLEYALEKEDEVLIGMLLAKGADPHVTKVDGPSAQSLFDWAVEENKLNLVKQLMETGKVNPSTEAVYKAAQKGHKEMLEHFKHHGFIDVRDKNQNTALARAVNQREKQTFEVLLQQGADPTIEDQEGKRVLTKAIDYKKLEFLAGILDRQALVAIFLEN
ncbi:MAG: ankyrin repeat domain-containing protein, partial [Cytophagales bacterium]|nr:ankyrin repeat domain-containing protein [Cytophagales bacterium]